MSGLRIAAKQALKVPEAGTDVDPIFAGETEVALRAALAQQDEPLNLSDRAVQRRLAAQWGYVPAAQAEPAQEPVAEVFVRRDGVSFAFWLKAPPPERTKLYTAPPQRKPLTEEEIVDAVREADLDWQKGWTLDETQSNWFVTLARAVERAHGIKEN